MKEEPTEVVKEGHTEAMEEAKKEANLAKMIKESAEHVTQLATFDIPQVADDP